MANGLSIIDVRLDAIEKAQQRYRTAFFLTTIVSTVLTVMAFNRTLSFEQGAPVYRGDTEPQKIIYQNELSRRLARDNYTIPLLGVNISVWDLGLIGPAALFIFAFYFSAASRSVRSQIEDLQSALPESEGDRERAYVRLKSQLVLNAIAEYGEGANREGTTLLSFSTFVFNALVFLPFAASLASIAAVVAELSKGSLSTPKVSYFHSMSEMQQVSTFAFDVIGLLLRNRFPVPYLIARRTAPAYCC